MPKNFHLPSYRFLRLQDGELKYISLKNFEEPTFVLCCLFSLTERDAWMLEAHGKEIRNSQGALALLLPQFFPSTDSWTRPLHEFDIPIFVDPLQRLCRSFQLFRSLPSRQCESLVFDHENRLKFRIIHHLNLRGLSTVVELSKCSRLSPLRVPLSSFASAPPNCALSYSPMVKQIPPYFRVPEPEVVARHSRT